MGSSRRPRSDRGRSRVDGRILSWLSEELSGHDRPKIAQVLVRLAARCQKAGLGTPSRATVYKRLETLPTPVYLFDALPAPVREALYNQGPSGRVPGHQVAFYCFNYGNAAAMSFAAGLPWLCLYQALRMPGYRTKSRGLIEAVALVRGV